jgi:hypothetical protein
MDNLWILVAVSISNLCQICIHARIHGLSTDYPLISTSSLQMSKIPHFCMFLRGFRFYVHGILVESPRCIQKHCSQDRGEYEDDFSVILGRVNVVILVKNHKKYPKKRDFDWFLSRHGVGIPSVFHLDLIPGGNSMGFHYQDL